MSEDIIWLNKKPYITNLRMNPGMRHNSRLHTRPTAYRRKNDFFHSEQLKIVRNNYNAEDQELLLLNEAKNLFGKQLPCMGNNYISRLVFDFHAETVLLLSDGIATGSITSRLFWEEQFIEIAFLAVDSSQQSKGYGRLIMNYLKQSMQVYPFYDILACADEGAVDYFKKLGFNMKSVQIDPQKWLHRIKDYVGVKLAYCKILPEIDYINFFQIAKKQLKYLEDHHGRHIISYPQKIIEPYKPYPEAPSLATISMPEVANIIQPTKKEKKNDLDHEMSKILSDYDSQMAILNSKCREILNVLNSDDEFNQVFYKPVTEDIAEGYFSRITNPMDFKTIERRLDRFPDYYKRPEEFALDVTLIIDNCKEYNGATSQYFQIANRLKKKLKKYYSEYFPDNPIP